MSEDTSNEYFKTIFLEDLNKEKNNWKKKQEKLESKKVKNSAVVVNSERIKISNELKLFQNNLYTLICTPKKCPIKSLWGTPPFYTSFIMATLHIGKKTA